VIIEEFWHQAFLAALVGRTPAQAKRLADEATNLCIKHWQDERSHWAKPHLVKQKDLNITFVPMAEITAPASVKRVAKRRTKG
jgi:hypothetical protein